MATGGERILTGIVGDYTVTYRPRIGGGTFGQVYKAVHNETNKLVAVKEIIISNEGERNDYMHDMARRELRFMLSLHHHPNIVRLIEDRFEPDACYLFMEYCQLGHLKTYLSNNKNLDFTSRIGIMQQLASAFSFMHGQYPPVIHRDIKLENVLMQREHRRDVVKVVDFGLAKLCEEQMAASLSTVLENKKYMTTACGTQYFQAPEFFAELAGGLKYDASVDVFALGLVFTIVLQHGAEDDELLPISVGAKRSGKVVNIGTEMLHCYREKKSMPVMVEYTARDDINVKAVKRMILFMTKFKSSDRKNIGEVDQELGELMGRLVATEAVNLGLQQTENELQQKDNELQQKDSELQQKDNQLQQRENELQEKHNELDLMRQRMNALQLQNAELVRQQRTAQEVVKPRHTRMRTVESKTADAPTTLLDLPTDVLSHISERQWTRKTSLPLSLWFIESTVRLIKGEIWVCGYENIQIFDTELSHLKTIQLAEGVVYDVAELTSSDVIVATDGGLHHISSEGKELAEIDSGWFTSVAFYNGVVYAAYDGGEIRMYKQRNSWKQTGSIKLNCEKGYNITLSVNSSGVYVCYNYEARVDIFSHTGELKLSHDLTYGSKEDVYPRISSADESGNMLITDEKSGSVSVVSREGQKSVVTLNPQPKQPMCALFYPDRLYVTDWETDCVILYS